MKVCLALVKSSLVFVLVEGRQLSALFFLLILEAISAEPPCDSAEAPCNSAEALQKSAEALQKSVNLGNKRTPF